MERTPRHLVPHYSLNTYVNLSKVADSEAVYPTAGPLLNSPGFSSCKRSKTKWIANEGSVLQDSSSLVLGLGLSMSSGKKIEEQSLISTGPSINLHLGDGRTTNWKNISCVTTSGLEVETPKLDLELSLSTGPADSDVTTLTQGVLSFQNAVESPVTCHLIQLVDEGSTSSRWTLRPLLPPLHTLHSKEIGARVDHAQSHCHTHIDLSPATPNLSSAKGFMEMSTAACTSELTHLQQQRSTSVKTCQFDGCTRGARGASGLCIAHGGGRRCQRAGCLKGAEGKTVFCKAHGGGKRCQHLGCTKSAEGHTDYCIGHGGGKRCSHEGCSRAARGKSGLCIRHGGGKRCCMENCSKSAEGISGLCISHGGGRRCQYPACTKGAQGSTMLCKAHGGGRRCTVLGCTKGAEGSTPLCKGHGGGKRCSFEGGCTKSVHGGTLFCVNHGGGKRCAVLECTRSARGSTNFCVRHGGGRRCKSEGCGKSAQSSTDYCKAHGGGKRCSWGLLGSEFGGQAAAPCDKFARGKSGLCATHSAKVQEKISHCIAFEKRKENNHADGIKDAGMVCPSLDLMGYRHQLIPVQAPYQDDLSVGNASLVQISLPEGRVHGGNLMAMLGGSNSFTANMDNPIVGGPSEPGKSCPVTRSWVQANIAPFV